MSRLPFLPLFVAILSILGCSSAHPDADAKLMQGDWRIERYEVDGRPWNDLKDNIMRINGNSMIGIDPLGNQSLEMKFTLEPGNKILVHMRGEGSYRLSRQSLELNLVWGTKKERTLISLSR